MPAVHKNVHGFLEGLSYKRCKVRKRQSFRCSRCKEERAQRRGNQNDCRKRNKVEVFDLSPLLRSTLLVGPKLICSPSHRVYPTMRSGLYVSCATSRSLRSCIAMSQTLSPCLFLSGTVLRASVWSMASWHMHHTNMTKMLQGLSSEHAPEGSPPPCISHLRVLLCIVQARRLHARTLGPRKEGATERLWKRNNKREGREAKGR